MFTLCINTALSETSICLVKDSEVLACESFQSQKNEAERLMPIISGMVEDPSSLDYVFVVKGPGPFSGIRVGIVTANTIASNLGVKLSAVSTFEYLKMSALGQDFDAVVLNAGGKSVFVMEKDEIEIMEVSEVKFGRIVCDLSTKQKELLGSQTEIVQNCLKFEQVCARIDFEKYVVKELPLLPYYVKEPSIG